jgi:hypothetical protein
MVALLLLSMGLAAANFGTMTNQAYLRLSDAGMSL